MNKSVFFFVIICIHTIYFYQYSLLLFHKLVTDSEHTMIQACISLIIVVVSNRHRIKFTSKEALRHDLIQWLAMNDATHSQLCQFISLNYTELEEFDAILDSISDFHSPNNGEMQNGVYRLKHKLWDEVDPFYVHKCRQDAIKTEEMFRKVISSSSK